MRRIGNKQMSLISPTDSLINHLREELESRDPASIYRLRTEGIKLTGTIYAFPNFDVSEDEFNDVDHWAFYTTMY